MRLLIVGINYAPEETGIAPYTAGLAEHLATLGHEVVALTGLPSYPAWHVYDGYRRRLWKRECINGVDVRRRWHYVPPRQSALRRGLYEASFLFTGLSALSLPRPDAVLGVVPSLSSGCVARLAAHRFRVPYGLIFQDLMGQAAGQSGVRGGSRVARLVRAAERWSTSRAGHIGIIAEGFRTYIESLGVSPDRITRLRNWTHVPPPLLDRVAVRRHLDIPDDAIVCLHAGNMGHKQHLENVLECARLAMDAAPRLLFVLMGDGNRRDDLEHLARGGGLPNVRFLPLQPKHLFPDVLAAADVLLVNQRGSVKDMSLPGKLTAYFISGRPVVAAVSRESETAREISAAGAGIIVKPDSPPALLAAIASLAADQTRSHALGQAGARFAERELVPAEVLRQYEAFLEIVAGPDVWDASASARVAPFHAHEYAESLVARQAEQPATRRRRAG